jgi:FdhD protein
MHPAVHAVDVVRVGPERDLADRDVAAAEEPLEIRLGGTPFVVIMRTPGADQALAAGFLLSEQVIRSRDELASMRYCAIEPETGRPVLDDDPRYEPPESGNVLNVWLAGEAAGRAAERLAGRRYVTANASCGVCGRRSIDDLLECVRVIDAPCRVPRAVIASLPDRLRDAQKVFDETGGLHAAGLFDTAGGLVAVAEDVGRHNAVDKVIGTELLAGRMLLGDRLLFVSGRTSFEIVQKAVVAGIPVVASVSAPSSLAIDLARQAGLTLLGFVRPGRFNIYTGAERITPRA